MTTRIWDVARDWLGPSLLGKILKEAGDDEKVKKAICDTLMKDPADPKTYFLATLREDVGPKAVPLWQMSPEALYALAVERKIPTRGKTHQQLLNDLR